MLDVLVPNASPVTMRGLRLTYLLKRRVQLTLVFGKTATVLFLAKSESCNESLRSSLRMPKTQSTYFISTGESSSSGSIGTSTHDRFTERLNRDNAFL